MATMVQVALRRLTKRPTVARTSASGIWLVASRPTRASDPRTEITRPRGVTEIPCCRSGRDVTMTAVLGETVKPNPDFCVANAYRPRLIRCLPSGERPEVGSRRRVSLISMLNPLSMSSLRMQDIFTKLTPVVMGPCIRRDDMRAVDPGEAG